MTRGVMARGVMARGVMARCLTMTFALAVLAAGAACGGGDDDAAGAVTIEVGAGRDTVPESGRIRVDFVVENHGSTPIVVVDCQGYLMRNVEKRIDGAWRTVALSGCPDAPTTEVTIQPGGTLASFEMFALPGTYRLQVWRRDVEPPFIPSPAIVIR